MNLAKQSTVIESIHDTLNDFVGQRLQVRANMGRSKMAGERRGPDAGAPQLFILEVDTKRGRKMRQSYQYVDVLTGMVTLSQNGESCSIPDRGSTRSPPRRGDRSGRFCGRERAGVACAPSDIARRREREAAASAHLFLRHLHACRYRKRRLNQAAY